MNTDTQDTRILEERTDNLRRTLARADEIDRAEGREAYFNYSRTLKALGEYYGASTAATVGAFCALSPNNDYMGNLRSTASVLAGFNAHVEPNRITVSTYNACKLRALRVLKGAPFLDFTKGPKTRSFYLNLLEPFNPEPVTIDGHMVSVWFGERMRMIQAAYAKWNYNEIAQAVRLVAAEEQLIPNQAQAIIWNTWKRIHNVRFQPQLCLFQDGNQWRCTIDPEDIKPFPIKGLQ